MTKKPKIPKWVWVSLLIPLLIGLYFAENIKGQFRFMQYCWKEGGLKVYEPLERDVGWEAESYHRAKYVASIDGVGFVRFYDEKNESYMDVVYIGGSVHRDTSYRTDKANLEKSIKYKWIGGVDYVIGELRLSKIYSEVKSIKDDRLLVRYNSFSYSQFNQDRTLLGAPSDVSCHPKAPPDGVGVGERRRSINSSIKNKQGK